MTEDIAADGWIELPDRYLEVSCPCGCGHAFEIDLMQWVAEDAER